jgi:hypothetical protein
MFTLIHARFIYRRFISTSLDRLKVNLQAISRLLNDEAMEVTITLAAQSNHQVARILIPLHLNSPKQTFERDTK